MTHLEYIKNLEDDLHINRITIEEFVKLIKEKLKEIDIETFKNLKKLVTNKIYSKDERCKWPYPSPNDLVEAYAEAERLVLTVFPDSLVTKGE